MRLILEKADLLKVLNAHFNENFDPELVQVRADPFEVELTGIPLPDRSEADAPAAAASTPRARTLGKNDGFDGDVHVTPPDAVPEDDDAFEGRSERNASREAPPVDPSETSDDPRTVLRAARDLERDA